MHMQARLILVVERDVADRAQHLALLIDWNLPIGLGGEVEPADGRLRKGAERGEGRGAQPLVLREVADRRAGLVAGIENKHKRPFARALMATFFISHSRGYASLTASANTAFPRGAVRGNFRTLPPDHAARRCSRRPSDLRRRAALPPERSRERRKAVTAASSALILSMLAD